MKIDRMELADLGNPVAIAQAILKQLPDVKPPIPIYDIAYALGIVEIKAVSTSEFEGTLIAYDDKSHGSILINERSNPYRQKFTVGHETGHFTNPWHAAEQGRFVCQAQGMITRADNKNDRYQKMESEANQFAAEILMPSNYMRQDLRRLTGLEVDHIVSLAEKYEVSKEAMGRRYIDFQDEPCALVFSRDGKIMHPYKHKNFPSLKVWNGDPAPADSMTARNQTNTDSSSEWIEQDADTWLSSERYEKVYEQVLAQKNGFKITLLTLDDEKDEEEEKIQSSWKPKLYK